MGLDDLWMPNLRGRIEQQINAVAEGQAQKNEVLGSKDLSSDLKVVMMF